VTQLQQIRIVVVTISFLWLPLIIVATIRNVFVTIGIVSTTIEIVFTTIEIVFTTTLVC